MPAKMPNPTPKMLNTRSVSIVAESKEKQAVFAGLSAKVLNRPVMNTFLRDVSVFGWRVTPIGDGNLFEDSRTGP